MKLILLIASIVMSATVYAYGSGIEVATIFAAINISTLIINSPLCKIDKQINPFQMYAAGACLYAYTPYIFAYFFDINYLIGVDASHLARSLSIINIYISIVILFLDVLNGRINQIDRAAREAASLSLVKPNYLLGMIASIYFIYVYASSGVFYLIGAEDSSRFVITETIETGKIWFIQYVMTGVTIAFLFSKIKINAPMSRWEIFPLILILIYWLLQLSIGNRRGFLTVLLAALAIYLIRGGRPKLFYACIFLFMVLGGFLGILRVVSGESSTILIASSFLGEFIYPWFTFQHQVQLNAEPTFEPTWISAPIEYAASKLIGSAYKSPAQLFAIDLHQGADFAMGYAYMPISEMYKSTGIIGAACTGGFVILTMIIMMSHKKKTPILYVILFSLCLDINRTDFFSMAMQFAIIYISIASVKLRIV